MDVQEIEVLKKFGVRLASLRSLFGLSQDQLAFMLGIDHQTMAGYEKGEQTPPLTLLREITRITQCDLDFLIAGRGFDFGDADNAVFQGTDEPSAFVSTAWYWETDKNHQVTLTCRPTEERATGNGIIGWTHWEYVGMDPGADSRWARHLCTLEKRRPFENFVFRGHKAFIKISGKPAFDSEGEFTGYRGYASTLSQVQALTNWRVTAKSA